MKSLTYLSAIEQQALAMFQQELLHQFGEVIQTLLLFGSKARGDSHAESDIDVLVLITSPDWRLRKAIRGLAAEVNLRYGVDISPRVWPLSEWQELRTMSAAIYQQIQQDGVELAANKVAY